MISLSARLKVFLGSFFIQSSWCFTKMQGLGFAAALSPALGELFADKQERAEALKRHVLYYNAHPYMASPILGAVINLEETVVRGDGDASAGRSLKEALMGPYGSIGDGFFWSMVRPVAALIGITAALLFGLWGPVIFLGVYNVFHIWMRWKGLSLGCKHGVGIIEAIGSLDLPAWSRRGCYVGSALLGVVSFLLVVQALSMNAGLTMGATRLGSYWHALTEGFKGWTPLVLELAFIATALILSVILTRYSNIQRLIYLVLLPVLILGFIFC